MCSSDLKKGVSVSSWDIERGEDHDLLDQSRWNKLYESYDQGEFDGSGHAPPCGTFSGLRCFDGGPVPLRSEWAPGIYGLGGLTPYDREQVREGTLFALRSAGICKSSHRQGLPFWTETPKRRPGVPCVFKLTEYIGLAALPGVSIEELVQCMMGARTSKPTEVLH